MLALLLAAATPQADLTPAIRCMVVAVVLSTSSDPKARSAGFASAQYWFGRIDRRLPDAELARRLDAERRRMTTAAIRQEGLRCGAELKARGEALVAMSAAMGGRDGN